MSLRYFSLRCFLSLYARFRVTVFVLGVSVCGAAFAAPAVQTYADQALPTQAPAAEEYYDSPLAAGTLTLQDVLEAHPHNPAPVLPVIGAAPAVNATAPLLTPPVQSSSTSLMMSQGMKDVLQKVGDTAVTPVKARTPDTQAQAAPTPLVPAADVATPTIESGGVKYEPGQQPKNLAAGVPTSSATVATNGAPTSTPSETPMAATSSAAVVPAAPAASLPAESQIASPATPAPAAVTEADQSCGKDVEKWEKNCGDAGYPSNYVGKIIGETRKGCSDGTLHDVWVTNSCAPPDIASSQTAKTDGACGVASNNEFDSAPSSNLCINGIASQVSGDGPWTWACSGINGGEAAACVAQKRLPATNGSCGDANGVTASAAPSSDLCDVGTATPVKGSGPWTWSCRGAGKGSSESCIAPVAAVAAPLPVPVAAPTAVAMQSEMPPSPAPVAPVAQSVANPVAPAHEIVPVTPSEPAAVAVSDKGELCGTAAETLAYEAPTKDLCRAGTASAVNGDGPWTWSCTDNEGVTSSCRTLSLSGDSAAAPAPQPSKPAAEVSPSPLPAPPAAAPQLPVAQEAAADNTASPPTPKETPFSHPSEPSVTELACGAAATQPALQAPTTDLCLGGKPTAMHGSGPWHWTCTGKAHRKVTCETPQTVDGSCGAANGTALKSAPFSGLCTFGTPSGIEGTGPWTWTCNGSGGGVNVSCAAAPVAKPVSIDGVCGTSDGANLSQAPANGLCTSGTPSAVSGEGPWTWSCSGSNGGVVGSCSANKIAAARAPGPSVNGLCGAANGVVVPAQPVDGLCATGTVSSVVGNGPWNWSCQGENGGMTVSCTAPLEPPAPIDGACGGANGVPTLVKPQSGLCAAGITGAVNGKGPWTWTCSGANGGTPASCVAAVAGKSGSIPSSMIAAADADALATPPTPSGLVTPHLPSSGAIPSLDKKTLPSLTSSKAFAPAPTPSSVPGMADVMGDQAPENIPTLPQGSEPVQTPSIRDSLPSAPVLQENAAEAVARIPGNHLVLDPTISTILFDRGSGNIAPNVLSTLDRLTAVLINNPDVRISLTAYADNNDTTPRDACRLSLTRALAVRDYLSSKGISESRIDVHAEGANTTTGYIDRVDVKVNE